MENVAEYSERREALNELVLSEADLSMRRFFALDHDVYREGALPKKAKELMGLVASTVLRCNDCISHHLIQSIEHGGVRRKSSKRWGLLWLSPGRSRFPICGTQGRF